MFASLKNKIKQEMGSDITTVVRNTGTVRGLNTRYPSQTGSLSSVTSSQISLEDVRDESLPLPSIHVKQDNNFFDLKLAEGAVLSAKDVKRIESREEEWRKRLLKKEAELIKKLERKEEELRIRTLEKDQELKRLADRYEKEKNKLVEEKFRVQGEKQSLETALNNAEEYKKKLYSFQESAEQMEGFQSQEMAKIKHLLLTKEQETEEKNQRLKSSLSEIDNLKNEISRLRRYEDELNNIQEKSTRQIEALDAQLKEAEKTISKKQSQLENLQIELNSGESHCTSLKSEVARLKLELEAERSNRANIGLSLEKERTEKDSALLRTAKISQEIHIAKQDLRRQESQNFELRNQLEKVQKTLSEKVKELNDRQDERVNCNGQGSENNEKALKTSLTDLEEQLNDKNKTIKVLQQRLADMKKTLQKELRVPAYSLDSDSEAAAAPAVINPSVSQTVTAKQAAKEEDVNFLYLKHVIMKFLTSREYEAINLTRAVATLLHLTVEEEKLLHDTLEWKMSWFGTKPNLGNGQTAKAIRPS